jgi:hypothetical protein
MFPGAECTPIPGLTLRPVDLYPAAVQDASGAFCARVDGLTRHGVRDVVRSVIRERDPASALQRYREVGFAEAYAPLVRPLADALRSAADELTAPGDAALASYLRLSATAFETDDWAPATDAWDHLDGSDRWYVHVGTRWSREDPCDVRQLPDVVLGRYAEEGPAMRDAIVGHEDEMFDAYRAEWPTLGVRDGPLAAHQLVAVIVAGGESRLASGGPVTWRTRARAVDFVSRPSRWRDEADALFSAPSPSAAADDDPSFMSLLSIVARRIEPFRFGDGTADAIGEILFVTRYVVRIAIAVWLGEHGVVEPAFARAQIASFVSGLFAALPWSIETPRGRTPLDARGLLLVLGLLADHGAVRWDPDARTVRGELGALVVDEARLFDAVRAAAHELLRIGLTNDRPAYDALVERWIVGTPIPLTTIDRRLATVGYTTRVYSVEL